MPFYAGAFDNNAFYVGGVPVPGMCQVTGSFYNPKTGLKIMSGQLRITPNGFKPFAGSIISPLVAIVEIPLSGNLDFYLAPSEDDGVDYTVELDPDPSSPVPLAMRPGYFKRTWEIPNQASITIAEL
jgi:hypothetical protein